MQPTETLSRLSRYLMLHASHLNSIGLLEGKMGISIFFFHYSVYSKKKIYKQFAEELIREIYKEINTGHSFHFVDGLSGIAWGMEYLVRNKFVTGNTDMVLRGLDSKILEWDVRYMKDCSLEKGLEGLARYVISRCCGNTSREIPDTYIQDLIASYQANASAGTNKDKITADLMIILHRRQVDFDTNFFDKIILDTKIPQRNIFTDKRPLGILHNGYSGIGLKMMQKV
jgi:hypothetical protein